MSAAMPAAAASLAFPEPEEATSVATPIAEEATTPLLLSPCEALAEAQARQRGRPGRSASDIADAAMAIACLRERGADICSVEQSGRARRAFGPDVLARAIAEAARPPRKEPSRQDMTDAAARLALLRAWGFDLVGATP
jgi:hypothetical protein